MTPCIQETPFCVYSPKIAPKAAILPPKSGLTPYTVLSKISTGR